MPVSESGKASNSTLANLELTRNEIFISKECNYNSIFNQLGSIENGVEETENLKFNSQIGCTALHFTVLYKNLKELQILLNSGADFTLKNKTGSTVLHLAIEELCKNKCGVDWFDMQSDRMFADAIFSAQLLYKVFKNPSDRNEFSHFHAACMFNCVELVEKLVENGAYINRAIAIDSPYFAGYTPLHLASKFFALEAVEILLKHGANLNVWDAEGMTPLDVLLDRSIHFLASSHNKNDSSIMERVNKIRKVLMGNSMNSDVTITDLLGLSLFHQICTMNDINMVENYLDKGLDINHCVDINSSFCPGYTALHFASLFSIRNVRMLMERGANIEVKDVKGMTPFDICVKVYRKNDICTIISLHPSWKSIAFAHKETESSVIYHPQLKLVDIVSAMSDPSDLDKFFKIKSCKGNMFIPVESSLWPGWTPLHIAVVISKEYDELNTFTEMIKILYKHGADLNSQDPRGRTPLHLAFQEGKLEMVELLLSHCRESLMEHVHDHYQLSHLHIACYANREVVVKRLLSQGADVDRAIVCSSNDKRYSYLQKYVGFTPLRFAAINKNERMLRLFLKRGAHMLSRDQNGITPLLAALQVRNPKVFLEVVISNRRLQRCVLLNVGLTVLHLAVCTSDMKQIERLVAAGADVNAQIFEDSPIWSGFTPLHLLVSFKDDWRRRQQEESNKAALFELNVVQCLLQYGAQVTLRDSRRETPLHLICKNWTDDQKTINTAYKDPALRLMLRAHTDFLKNRKNADGFSHFHMACVMGEVDVVSDFLKHGMVDVNSRVHAFTKTAPGSTALHLTMRGKCLSHPFVYKEMKIVDLLLRYGAIIELEDSHGNTPLHVAVSNRHFICENFFEMFSREGANVNARNARGETPLELLLKQPVSVEKVKYFLNFGCRLNEINPVTGRNLWTATLSCLDTTEVGDLIFMASLNFRNILKSDDQGRRIIHNVVSFGEDIFSTWKYRDILKYTQLLKNILGSKNDADEQDNSGRTPLHLAVDWLNHHGISVLLEAGADINIVNSFGQSALSKVFESRAELSKVSVYPTAKKLVQHVEQLLFCGLYVSQSNQELAEKIRDKMSIKKSIGEDFEIQLAKMSKEYIGVRSLTLRDFLTELGAVADYPVMNESNRERIDTFFETRYNHCCREFHNVAWIFLLQHRKAKARVHILMQANESLAGLIGFEFPETCSQYILKLLTNTELKMLIKSTIKT